MLLVPGSVADLPLNVPFHYAGSRLEAPFKSIFLAANVATVALQYVDPAIKLSDHGAATMNGAALDLTVDFPCPQLFRAAFDGDVTPHLWLRLNRQTPETEDEHQGPLNPIQGTVEDTIKAQFILFYEEHWQFVWGRANHNRDLIEATWGFARVARNAIGHSKIDIRDQKFTPVSWHGVTFGPAQDGDPLFSTKFGAPDLILLLLEMHFALVRLGAP